MLQQIMRAFEAHCEMIISQLDQLNCPYNKIRIIQSSTSSQMAVMRIPYPIFEFIQKNYTRQGVIKIEMIQFDFDYTQHQITVIGTHSLALFSFLLDTLVHNLQQTQKFIPKKP